MGINYIDKKCVILVDVGARGGIDPRWRFFKDQLELILFDADPTAQVISDNELGFSYTIIPIALGKKIGDVSLNICKGPDMSSIYEPNYCILDQWEKRERFNIIKKIMVPLSTLDSQLAQKNIPRIDFLKIDTQGSELDILEGAISALTDVIGLEIEVEFIEMYLDQPLFSDIDRFLKKHGFSLYDLHTRTWNYKLVKKSGSQRKNSKLIWGDALYFKDPEEILSKKDSNLLKRAVICYLAYGYDCIAWYCVKNAADYGIITPNEYQNITDLMQEWEKKQNRIFIKLLNYFPKPFISSLLKLLNCKSLGNYK